jgi:YVTN family beta-propeller protein
VVSVITDGRVTVTISLGGVSQPNGLAFDDSSQSLYISYWGEDQPVLVIDTTAGIVGSDYIEKLTCGPLAVDAIDGILFCAGGNSVSFVSTATRKVFKKVTVGKEPSALAVDPYRHVLYVGDYSVAKSGYEVTVVDTTTRKVIGAIPTALQPFGLGIDANHWLYVGDANGGGIDVIDPQTREQIRHIDLGQPIMGLAVDATHNVLYASHYFADTVTIIRLP